MYFHLFCLTASFKFDANCKLKERNVKVIQREDKSLQKMGENNDLFRSAT